MPGECRRTNATAPPRTINKIATVTSTHRSQRRGPGLGMPERLPGAIRSGPHWRRPARKDGSVTNPTPAEMIASLRRLPAGAALLERLGLSTRVHLVGGAVRDLLLEREPPDLDLVLEGDALGLALRIDPDARRHGRFGTATFMVNGFVFDIATGRLREVK